MAVVVAPHVGAAEIHQGQWTHFGTRPLGMGNAFVAVVDDYNALFYNPAGLIRIDRVTWEVLHIAFDVSKNTADVARSFAEDAGEVDTAKVLDVFERESGKPHYAAFILTPYLIGPNWGSAIGAEFSFGFTSHETVMVDTQIRSSVIWPLSYAMSLFDGEFALGYTVKGVFETVIDQKVGIDSISIFTSSQKKNFSDLAEGGLGPGFDFGVLFAPKQVLGASFGLSITDIGGTKLRRIDKRTKTPRVRLPSVNMGLSAKLGLPSSQYLLFAIDTHSINQPSHYSQKLNFGVEYALSPSLRFQGGVKAGYLSAGIQIDVRLLKLRICSYAMDHAPVSGLSRQNVDRRYRLDLSLLF